MLFRQGITTKKGSNTETGDATAAVAPRQLSEVIGPRRWVGARHFDPGTRNALSVSRISAINKGVLIFWSLVFVFDLRGELLQWVSVEPAVEGCE